MARKIKEQQGDEIIIVIGGPSVTYSSKDSRIRHSRGDLFVRGDGEEAFYQILELDKKYILKEGDKIPGVSSKQRTDNGVVSTDLDSIPSVFPIQFQTDHVYWETVRGCVFNCIFCAHPGQKSQFREFPMAKVILESEYLKSKGFKAIYITDPILGGSKERSKEVLRLLKNLDGSFITAEYRPEYLDEEVMDLLEMAKIGWLEFGLQTTNSNLSYFRKNSPSGKEKLEKLAKRNIKYSLDLMVGIPGDTREGFEDSLRFAIEFARPTSLKVFPLRVYDGTVLHQMAQKEGSWQYNQETRIISRSHTFDENELLKWMNLGRTSMQLYKFLTKNNWFNRESEFRNINLFNKFADRFSNKITEEYNEEEMNYFWQVYNS